MDPVVAQLFDGELDEWVNVLPAYQQRSIRPILDTSEPTEVALAWLSAAGPSDTAGFGAVNRGVNLFFDNLLVEISALLCTESGYADERQGVLRSAKAGRTAFVTALCTAVEPRIGASAVLLAPAVTLICAVIGSAGKDSVCTVLGEIIENRKQREQKNDLSQAAKE